MNWEETTDAGMISIMDPVARCVQDQVAAPWHSGD
jgi:hypothetical protein